MDAEKCALPAAQRDVAVCLCRGELGLPDIEFVATQRLCSLELHPAEVPNVLGDGGEVEHLAIVARRDADAEGDADIASLETRGRDGDSGGVFLRLRRCAGLGSRLHDAGRFELSRVAHFLNLRRFALPAVIHRGDECGDDLCVAFCHQRLDLLAGSFDLRFVAQFRQQGERRLFRQRDDLQLGVAFPRARRGGRGRDCPRCRARRILRTEERRSDGEENPGEFHRDVILPAIGASGELRCPAQGVNKSG